MQELRQTCNHSWFGISASLLSSQLTAGLNSHRIYEPNVFSEQLSWSGPGFKVPEGTGFGYDEDLFDTLDWRE